MELTISNQPMIFLYACLLGIGLGICYDAFRVFRVAFPFGAIVTFLEDAFYFILVAFSTFSFFLSFTQGQLRAYVLAGELIGWIAYHFTIGFLVMKTSKAIVFVIKKILLFLYGIFLKPFIRFFRWIGRKICKFSVKTAGKVKNSGIRKKFCLKKGEELLYNRSNHRVKKAKGVKRDGKGRKKKA